MGPLEREIYPARRIWVGQLGPGEGGLFTALCPNQQPIRPVNHEKQEREPHEQSPPPIRFVLILRSFRHSNEEQEGELRKSENQRCDGVNPIAPGSCVFDCREPVSCEHDNRNEESEENQRKSYHNKPPPFIKNAPGLRDGNWCTRKILVFLLLVSFAGTPILPCKQGIR